MDRPTEKAPRRSYVELFLISFLILFFELACIRWFGSYVVFLSFFTNVVLLASFVGMSIGCLVASRKRDFINWTPPLTLAAVAWTLGLLLLYKVYGMAVDAETSSRVFFGSDFALPDARTFVVPVELIAAGTFMLVTLIFIGLGQILGRRLDPIPNRVLAYTTNILGSLVGIVAFGLMSLFGLSPFWWFLIGLVGSCYFLTGSRSRRAIGWSSAVVATVAVGLAGWGVGFKQFERVADKEVHWSPYNRIHFDHSDLTIGVNNIPHQGMNRLGTEGLAYVLPYLLNRDTGRAPFEEVLIIGAGGGNDVAAALWGGAKHVDAVEIDPVILALGKRNHPNKPYADSRVTAHVEDGRNFLEDSDKKYDLIVYALVDSLILHSGYASIRLENFLFTEQAFQRVRDRLKPNGQFVMYNQYRQGWIVGRLNRMAKNVFGSDPVVISLPYREAVTPGGTGGGQTFLLAGDVGQIRKAFDGAGSKPAYWLPETWAAGERMPTEKNRLGATRTIGFGAGPPKSTNTPGVKEAVRIAPSVIVDSEASERLPSDRWPFLYTKENRIPDLSWRGMALIAGLSLVTLFLFRPKERGGRFNWALFFLGAGFMLLETKSVVHFALLFGSTWSVNSIVFFAILVMILLSNLVVLTFRPERLTAWFIALLLSLGLNIAIDLEVFLGLPEALKLIGACSIVFLPIFFAGVIFASLFRQSKQPNLDFGANIAGVVLGGLAENLSMVLGFQNLLGVAILFYLLAWLFRRRLAL